MIRTLCRSILNACVITVATAVFSNGAIGQESKVAVQTAYAKCAAPSLWGGRAPIFTPRFIRKRKRFNKGAADWICVNFDKERTVDKTYCGSTPSSANPSTEGCTHGRTCPNGAGTFSSWKDTYYDVKRRRICVYFQNWKRSTTEAVFVVRLNKNLEAGD